MRKRADLEDYITLTEAARIAGCTQQRISQLVAAKRVPHAIVAGRPVIRREDAENILVRAPRKAQLEKVAS